MTFHANFPVKKLPIFTRKFAVFTLIFVIFVIDGVVVFGAWKPTTITITTVSVAISIVCAWIRISVKSRIATIIITRSGCGAKSGRVLFVQCPSWN